MSHTGTTFNTHETKSSMRLLSSYFNRISLIITSASESAATSSSKRHYWDSLMKLIEVLNRQILILFFTKTRRVFTFNLLTRSLGKCNVFHRKYAFDSFTGEM